MSVEVKEYQLNHTPNFLCIYALIILHNLLFRKAFSWSTLTVSLPPPALQSYSEFLHLHQLLTLLHSPLRIPCFRLQKCAEKKSTPGSSGLLVVSEAHAAFSFLFHREWEVRFYRYVLFSSVIWKSRSQRQQTCRRGGEADSDWLEFSLCSCSRVGTKCNTFWFS